MVGGEVGADNRGAFEQGSIDGIEVVDLTRKGWPEAFGEHIDQDVGRSLTAPAAIRFSQQAPFDDAVEGRDHEAGISRRGFAKLWRHRRHAAGAEPCIEVPGDVPFGQWTEPNLDGCRRRAKCRQQPLHPLRVRRRMRQRRRPQHQQFRRLARPASTSSALIVAASAS